MYEEETIYLETGGNLERESKGPYFSGSKFSTSSMFKVKKISLDLQILYMLLSISDMCYCSSSIRSDNVSNFLFNLCYISLFLMNNHVSDLNIVTLFGFLQCIILVLLSKLL